MKDEILDRYTRELLYQLLLENKALERGREPSVEKLDAATKRDLELLESELRRINEASAGKGASFWQATRNPIKRIYRRILYMLFRPLINSQIEDVSAVARALIHLKDYSKSYMDLRAKAFEVDFNRSFINLTEVISKVFHPQIQRIYDQQVELISSIANMKNSIADAKFSISELRSSAKPPSSGGSSARKIEDISSGGRGDFYLAFENKFRGNRKELLKKYSTYGDYFEKEQQIIDLGCGKGEFLEAMSKNGFDVYGVDAIEEMVAQCTKLGLKAVQGNVFEYLGDQKDNSIEAVYCGMLIEHLSSDDVVDFLSILSKKLKHSARLVIETINPGSLSVITGSFVADLSHKTLVHSKTLEFILGFFGFNVIKTVFSSPIPDEQRLKTFEPDQLGGEAGELMKIFNNNFAIIDNFLFNFQDYITIAQKIG